MYGYKLFTPTWTAVKGKGGYSNPYQYEVGKCYEEPDKPQIARTGFHFCKHLTSCFKHYDIEVRNRIALVEAYGEVDESDWACSTNKIKIVREIPWREALEICKREDKII